MIPAFLRRLFSAPRYLSLPAAGVDISDRSIKFVELHRHTHGVRIAHYGKQALPDEVVQGGKVLNAQRLVDELIVMKAELGTSFVNVALPEEQAYLFSTTVPKMKADEIRDSLSLQMERFVPIPLQDVIFDFDVVSIQNGTFEVQVVAIDKKTVYSYLDVFTKAGLQVVLFELEPQSTARALLPKEHDETIMVVDFGDTHTGISVIENGYVLFTTTSDITGLRYEAAIGKALKVDREEANQLKRKHGVLEHADMQAVHEELISLTSLLAKELQKTVQYWQAQQAKERRSKNTMISRLYFCGGNAHMPGLLPELQDAITVPVEKGDPWTRIRDTHNAYVPVITPDIALSYTGAVGLAIAGLDHD